MAIKKHVIKESSVPYSKSADRSSGVTKIDKAIKRGLNKRSRLYKDVILKHRKAWAKLANL